MTALASPVNLAPANLDCGPSLRTLAMPADANPNGDIFGGWVVSQMDIAGGIVAVRRTKGRVATVGIETISFHKPIWVGDEVNCFATIERTGRTSIRVRIECWVRRLLSGEAHKVTEGVITYVAVDDKGRPRLIENQPQPSSPNA
ncbi:acyl-CoA thioesterase YciA [Azospirillaceae bacterium]